MFEKKSKRPISLMDLPEKVLDNLNTSSSSDLGDSSKENDQPIKRIKFDNVSNTVIKVNC